MKFDEELALRIRQILADQEGILEQEIFGGLSFLADGHMCCGVLGEDLVVRVGPEAYEEALTEPHARKMDFSHRPRRGFVYVEPAGTESDENLRRWVERGLTYARSLPPK